jgi:hypothetical protein
MCIRSVLSGAFMNSELETFFISAIQISFILASSHAQNRPMLSGACVYVRCIRSVLSGAFINSELETFFISAIQISFILASSHTPNRLVLSGASHTSGASRCTHKLGTRNSLHFSVTQIFFIFAYNKLKTVWCFPVHRTRPMLPGALINSELEIFFIFQQHKYSLFLLITKKRKCPVSCPCTCSIA